MIILAVLHTISINIFPHFEISTPSAVKRFDVVVAQRCLGYSSFAVATFHTTRGGYSVRSDVTSPDMIGSDRIPNKNEHCGRLTHFQFPLLPSVRRTPPKMLDCEEMAPSVACCFFFCSCRLPDNTTSSLEQAYYDSLKS